MPKIAQKSVEESEAERQGAQSAEPALAPAFVAAKLSLASTLQPLHGAHVSISGAHDGAYEVLMYDLTGTGILASHATSADGAQQDLYLFNEADRSVYETVLRGIRYANRAPAPSVGARHLKIDITDATAFAEPVYAATIEIATPADDAAPADPVMPPEAIGPAAEGYDLLAPDLLRQTAENIQFAAFEFAPMGTATRFFGDGGAPFEDDERERAADSGDLFTGEGAPYTLFEQAARRMTGPDRDQTSLLSNGQYLLFIRQGDARTAQQPAEMDLLDGRAYRLFREREPNGAYGSDAATLLVQDPESGAWFSAPAISQLSDAAPVVAIKDSDTRRRLDPADAAFRQAA